MDEQKTPPKNPTALLTSSSESKPHLGKMLFSATKYQI